MANQVLAQLVGQLSEMTRAIHTQGIAQMIQPFDGQPSRFRTWMKAIDKYAAIVGANDVRKAITAYQTSSGVVSDFVKRFFGRSGLRDMARTKATVDIKVCRGDRRATCLRVATNCTSGDG